MIFFLPSHLWRNLLPHAMDKRNLQLIDLVSKLLLREQRGYLLLETRHSLNGRSDSFSLFSSFLNLSSAPPPASKPLFYLNSLTTCRRSPASGRVKVVPSPSNCFLRVRANWWFKIVQMKETFCWQGGDSAFIIKRIAEQS